MKIKLNEIRIDGGTQPRKDIDEAIVSEYAEAMQDAYNFKSQDKIPLKFLAQEAKRKE